jgi:glycosyltransferase involved in cell wall biosynthesis
LSLAQAAALAVYAALLLAALAWVWVRPRHAILLLLALLPLHTLAMTLLFHFLHPSRTVLGVYQGWKDAVVLVALLRVATSRPAWAGQRPHAVDLAMALLAGVALLSIPFHRALGLGGEVLAFRNDFMLAPLYLLGRLTPAGARARLAAVVVLAGAGIAITAVGVVERFVDPIPLLRAIELPAFERFAYHFVFPSPYGLPYNYFQANFARRIGSVLLSAVDLATLGGLTVAAGAGLLRLRGLRWATALAVTALIAGVAAPVLAAGRLELALMPVLLALALALTRRLLPVAAAAAVLVFLFGLFDATFYAQRYPDLPTDARPAASAAISTFAAVTPTPGAGATVTPLVVSGDESLAVHLRSIEQSGSTALRHPLGQGLGAAGLSAARNQQAPGEGQLYAIAADLGVPGLLALLALLVAAAVTVWRARAGPEPPFAVATFLALFVIAATIPIGEVFTNLTAVAAGFWMLGQLVRCARAPASGPVLLDVTCLRTAQAGVRRYTEGLRESLGLLAPAIPTRETGAPVPRYRAPDTAARKVLRHGLLLGWYQVGLPLVAAVRGARLIVCPEYYCPWFAPCPRLVVFHDTLFWERAEYPRWWRALLWLNARGPARWAEVVAAPSASQTAGVARLLRRRSTSVVVLPPLVRPAPVPAALAGDLRELGLEPGYLLHLGVLEPRKDIPALVDAYAAARAGAPDLPPLVLAGPRSPIAALDDHARIEEAIDRHHLAGAVRTIGAVPEPRLPALLHGAAALVFVGRAEGFGLPLAEAMAAGVPVVGVASPATSEVVGDAGLLVPPGDTDALVAALRLVASDPEVRAELGERGRRQARRFSDEAVAARLRTLPVSR